MNKIEAITTSNGILLHFKLTLEEESVELSRQDLMDFVDTDIPIYFGVEKMSVNDYLGESACFTARVSQSSYNPF